MNLLCKLYLYIHWIIHLLVWNMSAFLHKLLRIRLGIYSNNLVHISLTSSPYNHIFITFFIMRSFQVYFPNCFFKIFHKFSTWFISDEFTGQSRNLVFHHERFDEFWIVKCGCNEVSLFSVLIYYLMKRL